MTESEQASHAMVKFIELANSLKDEGIPVKAVNWGLMNASATYSTYSVVGNKGGLNTSGVEKMTAVYQKCLEQVTEARKREFGAKTGSTSESA